MDTKDWKSQIIFYERNHIPFLVMVDFFKKNVLVWDIASACKEGVYFATPHFCNVSIPSFATTPPYHFDAKHLPAKDVQPVFDAAKKSIQRGETYLINISFSTPIACNLSLKEIFYLSQAPYKILYQDSFVVFSPECFVQIKQNKIYTYPMKGTILATIPDAENIILRDTKEAAEHATIVDLLRNDLSTIARNVSVQRYRFVQSVRSPLQTLLQVSSEIVGDMQPTQSMICQVIEHLLPAGSVSGAPKAKTIEIIQNIETHERGFYTGMFGYYDGHQFDSGVMIRMIQKQAGQLVYKSGAGITAKSVFEKEFQEIQNKIYVPIY